MFLLSTNGSVNAKELMFNSTMIPNKLLANLTTKHMQIITRNTNKLNENIDKIK